MTAVVKNNKINLNPKLSVRDAIATTGDDTHLIYCDSRYPTTIHVPVSATATFSVEVTTDTFSVDIVTGLNLKFDIENANNLWDIVKVLDVNKYIANGTKSITGVRIVSDQMTNAVPYSVTQVG